MRYLSTRGKAPPVTFSDVLLKGLAPDGGLYLPEQWPTFDISDLQKRSGSEPTYESVAGEIIWPFVEGTFSRKELNDLIERAYATFTSQRIVPTKNFTDNLWLAELFHGPTLAFKDIALQLVGQFFDNQLEKSSERITIVGATSGDTGSAAIEACRDRDAMDIIILHPHGKTSEVQRRQMTTVQASNVHNIAIEGNFDDCQNLVKAMFRDDAFNRSINMSAVNSINWARVMAQIVYYWWTAMEVANTTEVSFCVPSGNFGNVFAGYGAHLTGLPVNKFIVASNTNDVLDRFFTTGRMEAQTVAPTLSPSMDIQISSNFERLLFETLDRDGTEVESKFEEFRNEGFLAVDQLTLAQLKTKWASSRVNDDETLQTIASIYEETGELIDPHTAVGVAAAKQHIEDPNIPIICLATAHPSKFPEAVHAATGIKPELPPHLANLHQREEVFSVLPNNLEDVKEFILRKARR